MITLRQVRYFLAVADAGKLSSAAGDLHVSQSAVSLAIQALESEVGVPLFSRQSGGMALTREGHRFVHHAKNIESTVADALRSMRADSSTLSGTIRVGVTYTLAGYFLFPVLARFRRACPGVDVVLIERERAELEPLLIDGEIDLALMITSNLGNRRRIAGETLYRSPRRIWLPSAHPLLARERIPLARLAEEPYVMFQADEAHTSAERYWSAAGVAPNVVFRTTSLEALRSMVATGAAVTILSDLMYRPWSLDGGRIETREAAVRLPTMDVGLAWRRGRKPSEAERRLRDYLAEFSSEQG